MKTQRLLLQTVMIKFGLALFVCGISFALPALAAEGMSEGTAVGKAEKDIPVVLKSAVVAGPVESPFSRLGVALGFILVLAAGGAVLARKYRLKQGGRSHAPQISLQNQFHLGPKKSLAIVRVAGESILIGITDHSISHIRTLSLLDEDMPDIPKKDFDQIVRGSFNDAEI